MFMWHKEYRDYPPDTPMIKEQVSPSHGIVGCEMHEINGWGHNYHIPLRRRKKGLFSKLLSSFFSLFGSPK